MPAKVNSKKSGLKERRSKVRAKGVSPRSEEIARLRKELDDLRWATEKTNEGIKILYKELATKNEELRKFDEMKSDFVARVSHELRTPMAVMSEGVSLVLDQALGPINEKQRKLLTVSQNAINRLSRIVKDLLDLSKIEAGMIVLRRRYLDLSVVAREVAESFQIRAKKKNITVTVKGPDSPAPLYFDVDKITQVLTNLVGNSLKFTHQGGIEIALTDQINQVECKVSDTGCGIAEKDLGTVFDKFKQVGREAGPGEKGTGLGLAISRNFVELHGGTIWVKSKINQGTQFIFVLPKLRIQEIFREIMDNQKNKINADGFCFSTVVFQIANGPGVQKKIGHQKYFEIMKYLEKTSFEALRKPEDTILCDEDRLIAVLPNTKKGEAKFCQDRITQLLEAVLSKDYPELRIRLNGRIYAIPEDTVQGNSIERLIFDRQALR